jgi:transmembrane sensor
MTSDRSTMAEQAAVWLVRLEGDAVREGDWLAFEAWLAASPAHRAAYDRAEAHWSDLDDQRAVVAAALATTAASVIPGHRRRREIRFGRHGTAWIATSSIAAVAAAAAVFVVLNPPAKPDLTFTTAPGEQRTIALEDGSTITMNGGSTLVVRYSRRRRLVKVGEAEAAFDVAHAPDRPFVVDVGANEVTVVGTAFNIRRNASSTRVTVKRGVVQVADNRTATAPVRLTVGQSLSQNDNQASPVVMQVQPDTAFGWTTRRIAYTDQPLGVVAEDISRAFNMPVRVDAGAQDLTFTGVLALDDESEVLRRLGLFLPISFQRAGDHFELSRRR